jgi:hypothetical protein
MSGEKALSSIEPREVRKFGLIAFFFFGALASALIFKGRLVFGCIFGAMCITGALIFLLPNPMKPVYRAWVLTGEAIGKVVTVVLLTLVYYGAITPYRFILWIFRKNLLPLRPDKTLSTYWVTRTEPAQPRDRFYKRY